MAHARKKILCVEDHREIAALGLSASNGISCFTEQQSQDGVRNPAHNLILLVLRLMISSRLANGYSEATSIWSALWVRSCLENCSSW